MSFNLGKSATPKLCDCGCGQQVGVAPYSSKVHGWKKGEPLRFVHGHNRRIKRRFRIDPKSGCWLWLLHIGKNGYANTRYRGRPTLAHRAIYQEFRGSIPNNLPLDHLCRNRACVNPAHLEPVTHAENTHRSPHVTKLAWEQIREIRKLYQAGDTLTKISKRFSICAGHVHGIVNSRSWKETKGAAA